jgi:hypothetical protein
LTIEPPSEIVRFAEDRLAARRRRDFVTADRLREEIEARGWQVADSGDAYRLAAKPAYDVVASVAALPDNSAVSDRRRCTVALVVDGWPDDLRRCVEGLLQFAPPDVVVCGLDLGNVDGAGDALHELARSHPQRVEEWHVSGPVGWATARTALLRVDVAAVHVWCDTSTMFDGDGVSPLLEALAEPSVVAAGWRGVNVDLDDEWRSFTDAGPGEVDVLLGYLLAVRREAGLAVGGPHPKARFYRNADLEFSLMLRAAGLGRLMVPAGELPVRQARHRGYHDSDPAYRDRESKRNYARLLAHFRGRTDLLAPRR